jgi:hypothetical protein
VQANYFVGMTPELFARGHGGDRRGDYNPPRILLSHRAHSGEHSGSCSEAVIDENDVAIHDGKRRTIVAIEALVMLNLALLAGSQRLNGGGGNLQMFRKRFIDDANAAACDRAEREFLIPGHTDLSNEENIEIAVKITRDFEGNGDSAAG